MKKIKAIISKLSAMVVLFTVVIFLIPLPKIPGYQTWKLSSDQYKDLPFFVADLQQFLTITLGDKKAVLLTPVVVKGDIKLDLPATNISAVLLQEKFRPYWANHFLLHFLPINEQTQSRTLFTMARRYVNLDMSPETYTVSFPNTADVLSWIKSVFNPAFVSLKDMQNTLVWNRADKHFSGGFTVKVFSLKNGISLDIGQLVGSYNQTPPQNFDLTGQDIVYHQDDIVFSIPEIIIQGQAPKQVRLTIPKMTSISPLFPAPVTIKDLSVIVQNTDTQTLLSGQIDALSMVQKTPVPVPKKIKLNITLDLGKARWEELLRQVDTLSLAVLEDKAVKVHGNIDYSQGKMDFDFDGKIVYGRLQGNLKMTIVNFDKLSPPARKINKLQCAFMQIYVRKIKPNPVEKDFLLRSACAGEDNGFLKNLRPFIDLTHRTTTAQQTTDILNLTIDPAGLHKRRP